jgi:CO/xanthine dehydrogenase FAD-binding subunit
MALLNDIAVLRPTTVTEALAALRDATAAGESLRMLAGCTDVLVDAHFGKKMPQRFLDLTALGDDLGGLQWNERGLWLGALCTYAQALADPRFVAELPALAKASSLVGATQIQSRGTFAGNVENGSPAADAVPALMALDAVVWLKSTEGSRAVPLAQYYTGYRQTQRRPDEMIAGIGMPHSAIARSGHWFRKVGTRSYQAITKVGLAGVFEWQDGRLHDPRVIAVSMAASITRCPHLEAALAGKTLAELDPQALREAQAQDLKPIDDVRSNGGYRAEVFARLLTEALRTTHEAIA